MSVKNINLNRDWEFTEEDFKLADTVLNGEIITNCLELDRQSLYEALLFSQISHRQYYTTQVNTFLGLKEAELTTPDQILADPEHVLEIIAERGSLFRQKTRYICNSAEFWKKSDFPERIVGDVNNGKQKGEKLRKELVENVTGIGYKIASLFGLKLGYQFVSFDTHIIEYLEHRGITKKLNINVSRGEIKSAKKYREAELEIKKIAEKEYNTTLERLGATVWAKQSTWNIEDMEKYVASISK